jgi:hypothetical protein
VFRVDLEGLASYRNWWEWVAEGIPSPRNTRVQGKLHRIPARWLHPHTPLQMHAVKAVKAVTCTNQ